MLDRFCGTGSTLAAAEAMGYANIGVEKAQRYFEMAKDAIGRWRVISQTELRESGMQEMGTLSALKVREVWQDEAKDFTPWLAENADLLGEALGMELVHQETEAGVGRYSADLLFKEESTSHMVVVENMFAPTDHDHLGKLITYAAGLGAAYAVLVAPEFREEHRSALNWLNSISDEDHGFFGVVIEAWRIGESLPAPRLRVEVKPDSWSRTVKAVTAESSTQALYRRFWGDFLPRLAERPGWGQRTPSRDNWMTFRSGRSGFTYGASFCKPDGRYRLRADAYIDTRDADTTKSAFDELYRRKARIEEAVGESLDWEPLDNKRGSRIALYFPETIHVSEEERWPEAQEWLIEAMGKMRDAFAPELDALADIAGP